MAETNSNSNQSLHALVVTSHFILSDMSRGNCDKLLSFCFGKIVTSFVDLFRTLILHYAISMPMWDGPPLGGGQEDKTPKVRFLIRDRS